MKLRRALFVVALEHWAGRDVKVYQAIHANPAFATPTTTPTTPPSRPATGGSTSRRWPG
jgi:hypothetical protein